MAAAPGRTAAVAFAEGHRGSTAGTRRSTRRSGSGPGCAALLALALFAAPHWAPLLPAAAGTVHAASATAARAPSWAQLPQAQKEFLAPLEESWDSLAVQTRRKLIGIAQRQATMTSEQRERVKSRLSQWSQLSAEERDRARKNYQQLNKLPADQRQDLARRWQEARQPWAPAAPAGADGGGEATTALPQQ
ncbi:MAG: DUF3106 domain-containing protein [bacterium]|jgi:gas vesicle protein|nr:DUF3106 domain-containing protein [Betaproteobacteria bacterium]